MQFTESLVRFSARLNRLFGSPKFFYGVLAFFIVNALWFALLSLYPMAFDENFHMGVIALYAEVWNPFALTQTPGADIYGAITTDPSYLFHYLMSFPYRLLTALIPHEPTVIVLLRLMNIALFVAALFVFRAVLHAARVTPAVTNVVLAVFVLIPVVPMLAGQVNYDNLVMPIVAGLFWYALQVRNSLVDRGRLPIIPAIAVILLILFGAVVKYAFLPIALGVCIVLGYELMRAAWRHRRAVFVEVMPDFRRSSKPFLVALAVGVVLGTVLFSQRYVVNYVRYGAIVPNCADVLSAQRCEAYGPWGRDYRYAQDKNGLEVVNLPEYVIGHWAYGMWHRLYFTLAGPTNDYATRKHLPIPSGTAVVIVVLATLVVLAFAPRLHRKHQVFLLFLVPTVLYIGVLLMTQYDGYVRTARPVAINGRYLIPLLPLIGAVGGMALLYAFRALKLTRYAGIFVLITLLLLLQGGGAITYIFYAEPAWLWQNAFVQQVQQIAQPIVRLWLIGK